MYLDKEIGEAGLSISPVFMSVGWRNFVLEIIPTVRLCWGYERTSFYKELTFQINWLTFFLNVCIHLDNLSLSLKKDEDISSN